MDPLIDRYVQRLKNVGHHFGCDPRSHDFRNLQRQLAEEDEEEEEEEEEEEPWEGVGRREQQDRPAPAPRLRDQPARDYLVRHEEEEVVIIEPQRVARRRVPPDARRQHDAPMTQAKRARVSTDERQASDGEPTGENTETQESEEVEGSDLFGDREYENHDNQRYVFVSHHNIGSCTWRQQCWIPGAVFWSWAGWTAPVYSGDTRCVSSFC